MKIIKPKKENYNNNSNSIISSIIYMLIGLILAFKSNEAISLLFYIIGVFILIYGLKNLIVYYKNKDNIYLKNINLSISIFSIILGILIIILANALEISIRYILGFFLIYMGISRLLNQISFNNYKNFNFLSNVVLIILGLYSILFSNVILVVIGWILIIYSCWMVFNYIKK